MQLMLPSLRIATVRDRLDPKPYKAQDEDVCRGSSTKASSLTSTPEEMRIFPGLRKECPKLPLICLKSCYLNG